jgi:hypothetical protein
MASSQIATSGAMTEGLEFELGKVAGRPAEPLELVVSREQEQNRDQNAADQKRDIVEGRHFPVDCRCHRFSLMVRGVCH